jgi:hypothetical protein
MLEFDAGILGGELPIHAGYGGVPLGFPGGDFGREGALVGDATIQALAGENRQLDLCPSGGWTSTALYASQVIEGDPLITRKGQPSITT